jgi:hypothetical protein
MGFETKKSVIDRGMAIVGTPPFPPFVRKMIHPDEDQS